MRVVNVRDYGSVTKAELAGVTYVGRPSLLGNPYSHLRHARGCIFVATREIAIDKYRRYLYQRLINRDPQIVATLEALKEDSVLGCWCVPLACHASIIAAAWEWWRKR